MQSRLVSFALFFCLCSAQSHQLVGFDRAFASNTHLASSADGSQQFGADQALGRGSGYWCSSGAAAGPVSVSWVGVSNSRKFARGLVVDWAYSPEFVKVLTSLDGVNFEEAVGWRGASQDEIAYRESFMFAHGRQVQAASVLMRGARPWKYFGISAVALVSELGAFMLVSAMPANVGEQCVVATNEGVHLMSCLAAIAAGDGLHAFRFREGQLVSVPTGACLTLPGANANGGGKLLLDLDCNGGRADAVFALSPSGQLTLPRLGEVCVMLAKSKQDASGRFHLVGADCGDARQDQQGLDKFFVVGLEQTSLQASSVAREVARVLVAAQTRLRNMVATLVSTLQSSQSCPMMKEQVLLPFSRGVKSSLHRVRRTAFEEAVDDHIGFDTSGLSALIREARGLLAKIQ